MSQRQYKLDITGLNPENLVSETRTLSTKLVDGRLFIIPQFAPFFTDGCKVLSIDGSLLTPGRDYAFMLDSPELSQATQKRICGGVVFTNPSMNTRVTVEYQTIGGNYIVPIANSYEQLIRDLRNPLFTTFSQIHGTPAGLPTYQHIHDISSVKGWDDLIEVMNNVYLALLGRSGGVNSGGGGSSSAVSAALQAHITNSNAHSKSAVGLGNVANLPVMDNADWDKELPTDAYITRKNLIYWGKLNITDRISGFEVELNDANTRIETNTGQIAKLSDSVSDLVGVVNAVNSGYVANLSAVAGLKDTVSINNAEVRALREELEYAQASVEKLTALVDPNSVTNYDNLTTEKIFLTGSHVVRLKPKTRFLLTLVGGGGGCGEHIIDGEPNLNHNGTNGGDTIAYTLRDLADGSPLTNTDPLMKACGGKGSGSTYAGLNNVITKHGVGGKGGFTIIKSGVTPLTNTAGRDGISGSGEVTTDDHSLINGFNHNGNQYGRGASAKRHIAQGGNGAILSGHITNNSTDIIELFIIVGGAGNSSRHEFNNSTSGIAIIKEV